MSWNSLTDRQKSLDRAIEQCGVKLNNSDACLRRVMNAIGASASEFIANTEEMLDQFEKDDEEWRKKGRALGFDF